jgi:hypothetical protein
MAPVKEWLSTEEVCSAMATTPAEKVMAGGGDNSVFVVINLMLTSLFIKRSN